LSNSSSGFLASPETRAPEPCLLSESESTAAKAGLPANKGLAATTLAAELDSPPSFEEDALVVVVVVVVVVLVLVAVAVAVRDRRGGEDGFFMRFRGFLVGARKAGRRSEA